MAGAKIWGTKGQKSLDRFKKQAVLSLRHLHG